MRHNGSKTLSRLSTTNATEARKSYIQEVVLAKLEFDTPVYVHSGIGNIDYDGDTYLGVGDFGSVRQIRESEALGPSPFELTLSGLDSALLAEALDAGNYGDSVTVYLGFRQDDGTLVDDPVQLAKGKLAYPVGNRGEDNSISIVVQHNLAFLEQVDGSRFSDEEQQKLYPGDEGFEYCWDMVNVARQLLWRNAPLPPVAGGGRDSPGTSPGLGRG